MNMQQWDGQSHRYEGGLWLLTEEEFSQKWDRVNSQ